MTRRNEEGTIDDDRRQDSRLAIPKNSLVDLSKIYTSNLEILCSLKNICSGNKWLRGRGIHVA